MLALAFELSLSQAEKLINHALKFDPSWPECSRAFQGKTIAFKLLQINQTVYAFFDGTQVALNSYGPETPDLTIEATPVALLEMAQTGQQKNIRLSGDAHLAQSLHLTLKQLNIDWEGAVADKLGDSAALGLSKFFQQTSQRLQTFKNDFLSDLADFAVDEKKLTPSQHAFDAFKKDVTELRYSVDRLEARINQLCSTKHDE